MDRNVYIDNIELDLAKKTYLEALNFKPMYEIIETGNSLGRVTKGPVYAKLSSPFYNASAMDGIAVIAERTSGASEVNPVTLLENKDFIYVNTGNPIQQPFNAVIMIEDVTPLEDEKISIIKSAYPWQHIRPIGEDIVAHEMILPSRHKIRGIDLGALLSGGINKIEVYRKIKVGIIPTGSEIINPDDEIGIGKIIDSNSAMFAGLVTEYGGIPKRSAPVPDKYQSLKDAIIKNVAENDLVIINAGSSAGTEDFTVHLIRELGSVVVHGIAIKPGKPTILGIINNKPVIGIPGYPVSAYISFENFVKPLILLSGGFNGENEEKLEVIMGKRVVSSFKHLEKVRVSIGYINNKFVAVPLSRGAGTTMSLVNADGIISIPQNCEGLEQGEVVDASLLKPIESIKKTVVSVGSHDIVLDLVRDRMPISSSHTGSLGGIMALKRDECHIAPIHLLDESTGIYNISYIKKYFPHREMALIKGVKREQGFIVKKGNPKKIESFRDLLRENISYVNRQNGSGTRILLDYHLKNENLNPESIVGYERVMPTHMAVAVAVQSGTADVGLGIMAAAKALDLDFVSITYEEYDFLLDSQIVKSENINNFCNILKNPEFRSEVEKLGGYNTENCGEIIFVK